MAEAGRKTDLTEELFIKIKGLVLEGNNLKEIANICQIPEITIYTWHSRNYLEFYNKVENWRRDRKLMLAEKNIEKILEMETINYVKDKHGNLLKINDTQILKVKSDVSKFVAETLGKQAYSKRTEQTGANGEPLSIQVVNYGDTAQLQSKELPTTAIEGN